MKTLHLVYIALLIVTTKLSSQKHNMYHYTVEDGLPTNYVYGVIEDIDGYIWAYTENGIAKFDGYDWQTLNSKNGLPGNDVYIMVKDDNEAIWGQTYNKKLFGISGDTVRQIDGSISSNTLTYFQGNATYIKLNNIFYFQNGKVHTSELKQNVNPEGNKTTTRISDSITISTSFSQTLNQRVLEKYIGQKLIKKIICPTDDFLFQIVVSVFDNPYNLIATKDNIHLTSYTVSPNIDIRYKDYGIEYKSNIRMYHEKNGFRISTDLGYWILDADLNVIDSFTDPFFYNNFDVNGINIDSDHNIWICTRNSGIFMIPKISQATSIINTPNTKDNAFEGIILTPDNKIYAANDQSKLYAINDHEILTQTECKDCNKYCGISYDPVNDLTMAHFKLGTLAIDLSDKIVNHLDYPYYNKNLRATNTKDNSVIQSTVINHPSNLKVKDDEVYISHYYGIYQLNTLSNKYTFIKYCDKFILQGDYPYYAICGDSLLKITHETTEAFYFSDTYYPSDILFLSQDKFLVGTENSGLLIYDKSLQSIEQILSTQHVKQIYQHENYYIVATLSGVYILDKSLKLLRHLTKANGLPSNEVNDLIVHDNKLYTATASGIGVTSLDNIVVDSNVSYTDLKISQIEVNGNQTANLTDLGNDDNNITFYHTLTHYASNGNINYEYRLLPRNKNWTSSTSPITRFYNLSSGSYQYEVRAIDAYGSIHKSPTVDFSIPKPIYFRWWFLLGTILLCVLGFLYYQKKRERDQKLIYEQEVELSKKMADLKLTALRSQMNPHFVFNALGAIQYYIQTHKVEDADNYLTMFALLMRKYLDSSKENMISVAEEVKLLDLYLSLEHMRFEDKFTYTIEVDESINAENEWLPSMMIQPFAENSVNHGLPLRNDNKGKITVQFTKQENTLVITITDNGIGRENAAQYKRKTHKSRGMKIIKDKISTLRESGLADIKIEQSTLSSDKQFPGSSTKLYVDIDR